MVAATSPCGLKEHIVFPEIDYDQVDEIWGMDVIVCTTAGNDDEARALSARLQFSVSHLRTRTCGRSLEESNG